MMSDRDEAVVIERRNGGTGSGLGLFILGAAIGAGVALLLAPEAGEETRARLRRGASRLRQKAREMTDNGLEAVDDFARQGRAAAKDARKALEDRLARHRDVAEDEEDGV